MHFFRFVSSVSLYAVYKCILFCCWCSKPSEIEFRDAFQMWTSVQTLSLKRSPGAMTTSTHFLVYVDERPCRNEIVWLDCSKMPPVESSVMSLDKSHWFPSELCCNDDQVILASSGHFTVEGDEVRAYTTSGNLLWKIDAESPDIEELEEIFAPGLAVDADGNLFVCDMGKDCVQMFASKDGTYLDCKIQKGQ